MIEGTASLGGILGLLSKGKTPQEDYPGSEKDPQRKKTDSIFQMVQHTLK
jgi:hypothetical protein